MYDNVKTGNIAEEVDILGPVYNTSMKYQSPAVVACGIAPSVMKLVVDCKLCHVLNHAAEPGETLPAVPTVALNVPLALLEGVCCAPPDVSPYP